MDGLTGEIRAAQIFVATLGASSFTYAEATWSQALPDWIAAHVRAFHLSGRFHQADGQRQFKSGITKACFYERWSIGLCRHGPALPHRHRPGAAYKPRDKAKVEVGVQSCSAGSSLACGIGSSSRWPSSTRRSALSSTTQRSHDARLGHEPARPLRAARPTALLALPATPYEYAEWKRCRVGLDYHVEIAKHYYSVPHPLLRQEVEARITAATVEIFYRGNRVASHLRSHRPHCPTTVPEHMPSSHRRYRDWTHERIRREAASIGPDTARWST